MRSTTGQNIVSPDTGLVETNYIPDGRHVTLCFMEAKEILIWKQAPGIIHLPSIPVED